MMSKLTTEELATLTALRDQFIKDLENLTILRKLLFEYSEREDISPEIEHFCSLLMTRVSLLENTLENRNTRELGKWRFE